MELNSICHLHCMGLFINFVLFLLWFDMFLYLVSANKNLTNLLKAMLSFTPIIDQPYTSHELPPLVSSCTLFPTTCWAMYMCELTLYVSHPHRRRTGGSRGATQRGVQLDLVGVSQSTLWRQGWTLVSFIFIFYFVRLLLCNKYSDDNMTFISIHSVIICVVFFGAYMRCTRLYPLNPGVTEVVSEECW
jgi:hypothetical protein